mmetsp:Transcript_42431/g.100702  ORF Transcript_42431/g.100702 Transcript_42431/m.100702 type:complete len:380 (-) Transcript_42431:118-1257(-)
MSFAERALKMRTLSEAFSRYPRLSTFWTRMVVLLPTCCSKSLVGALLNRTTVSCASISSPCALCRTLPLLPTTAQLPHPFLLSRSDSGTRLARSGDARATSSKLENSMIRCPPQLMEPFISSRIPLSATSTSFASSGSSLPSTLMEPSTCGDSLGASECCGACCSAARAGGNRPPACPAAAGRGVSGAWAAALWACAGGCFGLAFDWGLRLSGGGGAPANSKLGCFMYFGTSFLCCLSALSRASAIRGTSSTGTRSSTLGSLLHRISFGRGNKKDASKTSEPTSIPVFIADRRLCLTWRATSLCMPFARDSAEVSLSYKMIFVKKKDTANNSITIRNLFQLVFDRLALFGTEGDGSNIPGNEYGITLTRRVPSDSHICY